MVRPVGRVRAPGGTSVVTSGAGSTDGAGASGAGGGGGAGDHRAAGLQRPLGQVLGPLLVGTEGAGDVADELGVDALATHPERVVDGRPAHPRLLDGGAALTAYAADAGGDVTEGRQPGVGPQRLQLTDQVVVRPLWLHRVCSPTLVVKARA